MPPALIRRTPDELVTAWALAAARGDGEAVERLIRALQNEYAGT